MFNSESLRELQLQNKDKIATRLDKIKQISSDIIEAERLLSSAILPECSRQYTIGQETVRLCWSKQINKRKKRLIVEFPDGSLKCLDETKSEFRLECMPMLEDFLSLAFSFLI